VKQDHAGGDVHGAASFDVANTGAQKGAAVAQLYVTEDHPKVARPGHELKGFERVELARHLIIPLDARSFSYYDVAAKTWVIGSNQFTISVGDSVESLPLKEGLSLKVGSNSKICGK
jgi:beta-glucosidase